MPETKFGNEVASDLTNAMTDYSVDTAVLDTPDDQKEFRWTNDKWSQYLGYYEKIPELNATINAKATWTIGKGFDSNEITTMILGAIEGTGNDTFNTILANMIRVYHIGGDSFAEIIRDEEGTLLNLKPLDPANITIIFNKQGQILRYEQSSKIKENKPLSFKPEQIFHLARNRLADEVHGKSLISPIEDIILMRNEAMTDWKRVLHRNIDPLWIFHLDTDDQTKINQFKSKMDSARGKGENMYIPKGAIVPELVSTASNSSLNPLSWIDALNNYFFQATGVPDIILGGSRALTEASAKIAYLAFQQTIEGEQLYIEEAVLSQLNLEINLIFPASLENELLSDNKKDGELTASQPNDTAVTGMPINSPNLNQEVAR